MSEIKKEPIEVPGATVPFFTYKIGETQYYEFDTSKCGPPEPMVNAMAGLKLIDGPDKKLVMINHKKPMGLLAKIEENYQIEEEALPDGRVKLVFGYKPGASEQAKLDDSHCEG
ncbi:hypothetical protein [Nitratifractor salsuginis]|uniref:DUF2249 domain-containing protein n=1 Tax=Nitratifractor salsuginis (strain DSM 16511 / JCM 12458 / E9I37-1) TaxID=749222 RepID=E6X0J7_NITSE|nr:hypothetical protein [Nitratifractor salsuginis]ADV46847.1 hypothetical protein Nitsa_1599 [Nitratifractor salsuginis DSM 16511]